MVSKIQKKYFIIKKISNLNLNLNVFETRLKITSVLTCVCVKNSGRTAEELLDGQQHSSLTELQ
jgi:hypothetical protein